LFLGHSRASYQTGKFQKSAAFTNCGSQNQTIKAKPITDATIPTAATALLLIRRSLS
jgi:hypothetical protein